MTVQNDDFFSVSRLAYAPLVFDCGDPAIFANEVMSHRKSMKAAHVHGRWLGLELGKDFPVLAQKSDVDLVNYLDSESSKVVQVPGGRATFIGINFLETQDNEQSPHYTLSHRKKMLEREWHWSEKFQIPQTKALIESMLRPQQMLNCRALVTRKGSFVPFHKDFGGDEFRKNGYLQINLILSSGGSPLLIHTGERLIEVRSTAFIFNDANWHGVPKVTGDRVVLSVAAKMDVQFLSKLIDWDQAIQHSR